MHNIIYICIKFTIGYRNNIIIEKNTYVLYLIEYLSNNYINKLYNYLINTIFLTICIIFNIIFD